MRKSYSILCSRSCFARNVKWDFAADLNQVYKHAYVFCIAKWIEAHSGDNMCTVYTAVTLQLSFICDVSNSRLSSTYDMYSPTRESILQLKHGIKCITFFTKTLNITCSRTAYVFSSSHHSDLSRLKERHFWDTENSDFNWTFTSLHISHL